MTGTLETSTLETKVWWNYIHEDLRELLEESLLLIRKVDNWEEKFHDYAFIVFPSAKAYEGFLKTLFHDLEFINDEDFFGKRFRVGKALNPQLDEYLRHESVYDKLVNFCHGTALADNLWETWKESRNLLFHWYPNERNVISYDEAKQRIQNIINAMDFAYHECKIEKDAK